MRSELSEEHRTLRRTVEAFTDEHVRPNADAWEDDERLPDELYAQAGEHGLMGLIVPPEDGGTGADTIATGLALGELARGDTAAALSIGAHNVLATNHVTRTATGEVRETWLPRMASGEALGAWGLTEPGGGSDVLGMQTTVRRDGEELVLDGEKCFITNGSRADVAIVVARDEAGGYSAVLVPTQTPGFEGSREHELVCMKASDTAVMRFDACRVPTDHLLGEPGAGIQDAFACLNLERVVMAAISTATAEQALETALEYAKQREAFGGPIAQKQAIYSKLARLKMNVEASRELWLEAARARDDDRLGSGQAAQAKLFATEMAQDAARTAVHIHGGAGLERETGLERGVRDSLLGPIGGGTSEMQEIVIARGLGIDADPYSG